MIEFCPGQALGPEDPHLRWTAMPAEAIQKLRAPGSSGQGRPAARVVSPIPKEDHAAARAQSSLGMASTPSAESVSMQSAFEAAGEGSSTSGGPAQPRPATPDRPTRSQDPK